MFRTNIASMDATMRSVLQQRLQTSFDGVVRTAECSRTVANTNALLRSRAGILAMICWLAAYSCCSPASSPCTPALSHRKTTPSISAAPDNARSLLGAAAAGLPTSQSTAVPRKAAMLRRVHTSARPRTTTRLPSGTYSTTNVFSGTLQSENPGTQGRAALSSLAHPQPRPNTWLDRLTSSLASLLRASTQQTQRNADTSEAAPQSRNRSRGVGRIHSVMHDPHTYDPIILPRHPIVLCHGLYGFDVRGPFLGLEIHYWAKTLDILRKKMGVEVLVHGVPPTGSIQDRAESLHNFLLSDEAGVRGKKLNFVAHSMGGLDVRHLLTHIRPRADEYTPVSLTTISTPHRGSPFMDWCNANIGIGNDYIEKAIAEARAERAHLADREHRPSRTTTKVPYSLKSPLFTRPKPLQGSSSLPKKPASKQRGSEDSPVDSILSTANAASSAVGAAISSGSSTDDVADKVKEAVKQSTKGDGSLPFGLSSFIGSLSTLTGSFSSYMLSLLDTPAYAMLSTKYMNEVFNPKTPNVDGVKYYSIASRTPSLAIWHPLWLPKLILDAAAESRTAGGESDGSADALGGQDQGNDGLVSVESAKWGEFLGVMEGCDHWDLRGGGAPRWRQNINPSTGRPYPTKASEDTTPKQRAEADKSSSNWIDINRLLFSKSKSSSAKSEDSAKEARLSPASDAAISSASAATTAVEQPITAFRSFKQLAEAEGWNGVSLRDPEASDEGAEAAEAQQLDDGEHDGEHPALSSFHPQHQDDSLVQEIASWISDRLPSGNAERRAMAEQRDRLIEETGLTLYNPQVPELGSAQAQAKPDRPTGVVELAATAPSASRPAAAEVASIAAQAPSLAPHAAPFSTQQVAARTEQAKQDAEPTQPKRTRAEMSDLERFWTALCRHLHNEGH